jgi:CHAT domain
LTNNPNATAYPRIDPGHPPFADLRGLLRDAFEPKSLHRLSERFLFEDLRYRFSPNDNLDDMIDEVLEFCRTQSLWEELLDAVAGHAPRTYNDLAARRGWPQVPVPAHSPPLPEPALTGRPERPAAYGDVEIHVTGDPDRGYMVTIQKSQAGDASDAMQLPWAPEDLSRWLAQLEEGLLDQDTLARLGKSLFHALFGSHVRDRFVEARSGAKAGLRLRLWLDPPELQALPWELLYDAGLHEFIALSGRTLVTRYLSVPRGAPALEVTPPLRILVATASPHDRPPLDVAAEAVAIREAVAPLEAQDLVRLDVLPHAQVMTLRNTLRDFQPHLLHFAGHGGVGPDGGALLLEDTDGRSRPLYGSELSTMLKFTGVHLAVLNACLSARGAAVEAGPFDEQRRTLLGVGPALVEAGLGAVVAMQFSLSDRAAHLFAHDFYATLGRLEPVGLAVARAREVLQLEFGEGRREWATPVLFLRAPDGVIFVPTSTHAHGTNSL